MSSESDRRPQRKETRHWLDKQGSGGSLFSSLLGICAVLLLLDLVYKKKIEVDIEFIFGFSAIYGVICCVVLVLMAIFFRKLVKRDEDFYDR